MLALVLSALFSNISIADQTNTVVVSFSDKKFLSQLTFTMKLT